MSDTTSRGYPIPQKPETLFPDLRKALTSVNDDVGSLVTGVSYVPMSDGGNPPQILDDGFGNFIYIPYDP
jgi:hypothetical protein